MAYIPVVQRSLVTSEIRAGTKLSTGLGYYQLDEKAQKTRGQPGLNSCSMLKEKMVGSVGSMHLLRI